MTITGSEVRRMLRTQGLCGKMLNGAACAKTHGHDSGVHEQGWTVSTRVNADPYARDSRESVTTYVISDGVRSFTASDEANATWLAEVLDIAEGVGKAAPVARTG